MEIPMQLHNHFQLTPGQLTSCQLGWIEVTQQQGNVHVFVCPSVSAYLCECVRIQLDIHQPAADANSICVIKLHRTSTSILKRSSRVLNK